MNQEASSQTPQANGKTEKQFREELEALNKESNELNERRVRIQTEIERARAEKAQLEASLLAEFGTADLDQLAKILADRERFNEEALSKYRLGLAELKAEIAEVQQKLIQVK